MKLGITILAVMGLIGCRSTSGAKSAVLDAQAGALPVVADCGVGQDLHAPDFDISHCPKIPNLPGETTMPLDGGNISISLGAWELYPNFRIGTIVDTADGKRNLHDNKGGVTLLDNAVLNCWAKAYYRLKAILRDPPQEYLDLYKAGFQKRFYMFLSDMREDKGDFWDGKITAFQNHLVKWNFSVDKDGVCLQHTRSEFAAFSKARLEEVVPATPQAAE